MPRTLSATPESASALGATTLASERGTYPGADNNPGTDDFPGRGSDLASQAISTTTDYVPATVPFFVAHGSRVIFATPIT